MENKKRNKSRLIKRGGEYIVIKKCTSCGEEFEQYNSNQIYCDDCAKVIQKYYNSQRQEESIIYIWKPIIAEYENEFLYIGSTEHIKNRFSNHLHNHSLASNRIGDRQYNIYYSKVDGVTREELLAIEYYTIDRYEAINGRKPIGNGNDSFDFSTINSSRLIELMEIADGLQFDNKYDIKSHRLSDLKMKNLTNIEV